MTVNLGSRYVGQPVIPVPIDAAGHTRNVVFGPPPSFSQSFNYYVVNQGDRLDTIAAVALGRSELWYLIANSNPEIFYPDSLTPGSVIRIPRVP